MPLQLSCPDNLTGWPSSKSVPKAKCSAVDQSMFFSSFIDFLLFSTILTNFLFSSYPLGSSVIDKPICFNLSSLTDVSPLLCSRSGAAFNPDHCPSNQSALFGL